MRRRFLVVSLLTLLLGLPLVTMSAVAQDDTTLSVSQDSALGAILTDAAGMTLYLFTPDTTPDESTCYDQCAEAWPILTPEQATALPAGVPGELSTFERTDGTQQVAYNGIPLYYFARDEAAGDVNGQGVGGRWFVVYPGSEHGPYPEAPGEGTPTPESTLKVGFSEELGPFLTDAAGMTVYLFTEDASPGESTCYDDCAVNWPPVPAEGEVLLPPGIQGTLGTTERTDGVTQLTYNDIPLYLWIQDQAPGDTTGQDVGEVWYVVPPGTQHGDEPHHGMEGEHDMEDMGTPTG